MNPWGSKAAREVEANDALAGWERWIEMLEDHALDELEYTQLLNQRAAIPEQLEIAGKEAAWDTLDELDQRFFDLTVNSPGRPFPARAEPWAQRLPKDEDHRLYIAKDIAARAIDRGGEVAEVAEQLRYDFILSPGRTILALRHAGIPLGDSKLAVDATLNDRERAATDAARRAALRSIQDDLDP